MGRNWNWKLGRPGWREASVGPGRQRGVQENAHVLERMLLRTKVDAGQSRPGLRVPAGERWAFAVRGSRSVELVVRFSLIAFCFRFSLSMFSMLLITSDTHRTTCCLWYLSPVTASLVTRSPDTWYPSSPRQGLKVSRMVWFV